MLLPVAISPTKAQAPATDCASRGFSVELKARPVSSNGLNDGSIEIIMNGAKPFNVSITKGCTLKSSGTGITPKSQTALFTDLQAGSYLITVTDKNGCTFSECIFISEPEPLKAEVVVINDITCSGLKDGKAELMISGGIAPYAIEPLLDLNNLEAGNYKLTISDSGNCGQVNVEFVIKENPAVNLKVINVEQPLCSGDTKGLIEVSASGGTGRFSYFINKEDMNLTGIFTDLGSGIYTIYAVDEAGCIESTDMFINKVEPIQIDIDVYRASSDHARDGALTGVISGGTEPYNVLLYLGCNGEKSAFATSYDKSMVILYWGLPGDFYTLKVVDENGCQVSQCVDLNFAVPFLEIVEDLNQVEGEKSGTSLTLSNTNHYENTRNVRLYPTPFNTILNIEIDVIANTRVSVEILNLMGVRVASVFNEVVLTNGVQKMNFTPGGLANGIYLCKITVGGESRTERIVLKR